MEFTQPKGVTSVMGLPIGRLNDHESRIKALENASSSLGSEVSLTTPNGVTTIFNFTHNVGIIHWNGQQVFSIGNTPTFTKLSNTQIQFINGNVPVTNDDIINTY